MAPPPAITALTPATGLNDASVDIANLAGTGFLPGASVKLTKAGQSDIAASGVPAVINGGKITCTLPITGAALGKWNVAVTNADGQSYTLPNGFTVGAPGPAVSSLTPASAANTSGAYISNLAGTGFATYAAPTVLLRRTGYADIPAVNISVANDTKITCLLGIKDAAPGAWDVVITNPDTKTSTLAGGFTVNAPAPAPATVSPNTGYDIADLNVSITGTGFAAYAAPTVKLSKSGQADILAVNVSTISATQISCTLPLSGAGLGAWDVVVTNPDSQSGALSGWFTVQKTGNAPTVSSLYPAGAPNSAGVNITNLAGSRFASGATVKIGAGERRNPESNHLHSACFRRIARVVGHNRERAGTVARSIGGRVPGAGGGFCGTGAGAQQRVRPQFLKSVYRNQPGSIGTGGYKGLHPRRPAGAQDFRGRQERRSLVGRMGRQERRRFDRRQRHVYGPGGSTGHKRNQARCAGEIGKLYEKLH
jgi:hypothetical protein